MCGLDIIWEEFCHNSMDHLVEEAKAGIHPSLLKGSPTELVKHSCYALPVILITGGPECGPSLNFFELECFFLSVRAPNGGWALCSFVETSLHPKENTLLRKMSTHFRVSASQLTSWI